MKNDLSISGIPIYFVLILYDNNKKALSAGTLFIFVLYFIKYMIKQNRFIDDY